MSNHIDHVDTPVKTDEIKELILELVNTHPGIKGVELVTEAVSSVYKGECTRTLNAGVTTPSEDVISTINDLVKQGDIVEVEYVLPTMNYRIKSLYFPKDTKVTLCI